MGKASKWMVNFLLGKKEERTKKKDIGFLEENVANSAAIVPSSSSPRVPRRWSFGRSSSKEKGHKSCKSLDLITTNSLVVVRAIVDLEKQQQQSKAVLAAVAAAVEETVLPPKQEINEAIISRVVQESSVTRIQAVFRSYLARKALCALKGLVKLQALVRGHLVRKQTTATLRQMHTLMAIQVRARFHRIQTAEEETQLLVKSQSSRYKNIPHTRPLREPIDFNAYKAQAAVSKSKNGYLNHHSQMEKIENGIAAHFSGDFSFSKREHQYEEEFSISTTAHNTPQHYYHHETPKIIIPGRASISGQKPDYLLPLPHHHHHDHSFLPNYMANTESSRAKAARSQSEPKQRPGSNSKPKGTRTASMDRTGAPLVTQIQTQTETQRSSPRSDNRNQDPWFIKLYRSKRTTRDSESDANSTLTSLSNYGNSVMAYEPHVTMY
ncbi:hypothetical protein ACOSQ4_014916 [Xanthoceras sorbifolium]